MFDPQSYVPLESLPQGLRFLFVILVLWSVGWKILSIWKAARHGQKIWFGALFLINSIGILDLVYLGFFQKGEKNIIQKLRERRASKKPTSKTRKKI